MTTHTNPVNKPDADLIGEIVTVQVFPRKTHVDEELDPARLEKYTGYLEWLAQERNVVSFGLRGFKPLEYSRKFYVVEFYHHVRETRLRMSGLEF